MSKRTVVVFCEDQTDINEAVQHWVNENQYKKAYTFAASKKAGHFFKDADGNWAECDKTFKSQYKSVLVFEKD